MTIGNIKKIILGAVGAALMTAAPGFVFAESAGIEAYINGSKITDTNTPPLFDIQNFLPGDEATGVVKINNNGSAWIDAGVHSTVSGSNDLASHIGLKIIQGSATIFAGQLSDFFAGAGDGFTLSRIGGNDSATYNFLLTYPAGEIELQNAAVGFDLDFGVMDRQNKFTRIGGQRGPNKPGEDHTFQFRNVLTRRTGDTHCVISYETSEAAAGQIIYSGEDEAHLFKYNGEPLYGYAHIYPAMASQDYTDSRSFDIPNLDPCKNYYFRIVARVNGGGPTVSDEYIAAKTHDCGQVAGAATAAAAPAKEIVPENVIQFGQVAGAATESVPSELPAMRAGDFPPEKDAGTRCQSSLPWWIFLILAAAGIWRMAICARRHKQIADPKLKQALKRGFAGWLAYAISNVAAAGWIFLAQICLSWVWFVLAAALGLAAGVWERASAKV